jgi:hypothetical protein
MQRIDKLPDLQGLLRSVQLVKKVAVNVNDIASDARSNRCFMNFLVTYPRRHPLACESFLHLTISKDLIRLRIWRLGR